MNYEKTPYKKNVEVDGSTFIVWPNFQWYAAGRFK